MMGNRSRTTKRTKPFNHPLRRVMPRNAIGVLPGVNADDVGTFRSCDAFRCEMRQSLSWSLGAGSLVRQSRADYAHSSAVSNLEYSVGAGPTSYDEMVSTAWSLSDVVQNKAVAGEFSPVGCQLQCVLAFARRARDGPTRPTVLRR